MPRTAIVTEAKACLPPELCQDPQVWIAERGDNGCQEWEDLLTQALQEREEALCLVSASSVSHSYQRALQGAHRLRGKPQAAVHVLDTGTTGIGLGLIALEAARLAQQGASLKEVKDRCQELRQRVQTLGVLATLNPLAASGVVSGAAQWRRQLEEEFTGILLFQQGSVELLSAVHGRERSLQRLARQVTARCRLAPVHGGIMYSTSSEEADLLGEMLVVARVNLVEFYVVPMHPSLAQATGPGALVMSFYTIFS